MNKCFDERIISYKRPKISVPSDFYARKDRTGVRKNAERGRIAHMSGKFSGIFLLLLSTFGGYTAKDSLKIKRKAEKFLMNCVLYAGIAFALWVILFVMSSLVDAATLLPTWSLIVVFAATVLISAGVVKK